MRGKLPGEGEHVCEALLPEGYGECEVLKDGWWDRRETQQGNSGEWSCQVVGPARLYDVSYRLNPKSNWKLLKGTNFGENFSPKLQHENILLTAVRLEGLWDGWIRFKERAAEGSSLSLHFARRVDGTLYAPKSSSLNRVQKPVHFLDIQTKNSSSPWAMAGTHNALFWRGSKPSRHWKIE